MKFKAFFIQLAILAGMLLTSMPEAHALPKNFRNVDSFYVGAMPSEADIDEFHELGISTIVSLHRLPDEVKKKAEKAGISVYTFPIRTRLMHIDEIMDVMRKAPANSVYLHCLHGADRTGAVTAYWLVSQRHMEPFKALATVISPSDFHVKGLYMLAKEYGITIAPIEQSQIGKYSGARNGGLEGLKIRGDEWYTRLARNYLLITVGTPAGKPQEKFWNKDYDRTKAVREARKSQPDLPQPPQK